MDWARHRVSAGRVFIPVGFLFSFYPDVSSAAALSLGIFFSLVFGNPYIKHTQKWTKPLLAWSIVGLGAGVNILVIIEAGLSGFLFTLISISLTLVLGVLLGIIMKTDRETSILINVGTAICGGSAIAAMSFAIRARDESTSIALGIVFILNALALIIFPPLGAWLNLSEDQFGLWGALAIHDTSSVVGATLQYGARALEVGTTVKLVRALWIIPVVLTIAKFYAHKNMNTPGAGTKYPWFIGGFVVTSILATSFDTLGPVAHIVESVGRRSLVATLFLIGSGLTLTVLKKVGIRAFAQGVGLWMLVSVGSLAAVYILYR